MRLDCPLAAVDLAHPLGDQQSALERTEAFAGLGEVGSHRLEFAIKSVHAKKKPTAIGRSVVPTTKVAPSSYGT
ncbi:hypothetical protein ABIC01_000879 [Bradyrhizobium sp. RT4b]